LGLALGAGLLVGRLELDNRPDVSLVVVAGIILLVGALLPALFSFDFRKDFDRMDLLKSLPISSTALVIGQTLTPVLCWTTIQTLATLGFVCLVPRLERPALLWALMPLALPFNLLLVTLDNIVFLLAPSPPIPTARHLSGLKMLLGFGKLAAVYAALGIAAGLAVAAYFLAGRVLWPALVAAWLALAVVAAALLPLAALAFQHFDVARDRPG
jgi:hypothetical protein